MSATTDGGRTSTVLARLPGPVTWVAVAPSRVAWAIVGACTKGTCSHELCRSSDGGASWSRLGPAPLQAVAFGDAAHGLAVGGGILSTADGGRTWRGLASPCPDGARGVSMVSARRGWLLCVRILGVGNADKTVYRTDDGGVHWRRLAHVGFAPRQRRFAGGLHLYGYPQGIAFARDGTGVLWESRGTLFLTRDGGRHWTPYPQVARPEDDVGLSAAAVAGHAFALLVRTSLRPVPFRLVATGTARVRRRTVRIWPSAIG